MSSTDRAERTIRFTVEAVQAYALSEGDTVWAPDDGDWLTIHRIKPSDWGPTVYRRDGSLAEFGERGNVLRMVASS